MDIIFIVNALKEKAIRDKRNLQKNVYKATDAPTDVPSPAPPTPSPSPAPTPSPSPAPNSTTTDSSSELTINYNTLTVISFLIGIYAAYLSWTCNTATGVELPLKVIYAIFAYCFGTLYLIYYFLVRAEFCKTKK